MTPLCIRLVRTLRFRTADWLIRFAGAGGLVLMVTAAASAAGSVTVSRPWFRYLIAQVPAGGYMTLSNASSRPATLTGAASPACGMLMLHRSETSGGAEKMVSVGSVVVPAGGSFSFAPGGYHLMCMQPRMSPGEKVDVTLSFQGGETVNATFPVFGVHDQPAGQ